MSDSASTPRPDGDAHDPLRRSLLVSFVFGYTAWSMPRALAASPDEAAYAAFLTTSHFLTGHASLDENQAARLYKALSQDDPGFSVDVQSLRTLIESRRLEPLQLQTILNTEKSPLSALPRSIATAWYLGIVGEGTRARCVAFEDNLTNIAVKDQLAPPSYCFGSYGSWAQKPT